MLNLATSTIIVILGIEFETNLLLHIYCKINLFISECFSKYIIKRGLHFIKRIKPYSRCIFHIKWNLHGYYIIVTFTHHLWTQLTLCVMCVQSSYWLATKKRLQAAIFWIKTTTITTIIRDLWNKIGPILRHSFSFRVCLFIQDRNSGIYNIVCVRWSKKNVSNAKKLNFFRIWFLTFDIVKRNQLSVGFNTH